MTNNPIHDVVQEMRNKATELEDDILVSMRESFSNIRAARQLNEYADKVEKAYAEVVHMVEQRCTNSKDFYKDL